MWARPWTSQIELDMLSPDDHVQRARYMKRFILLTIAACGIFAASSSESLAQTPTTKRVWTIDEIMSERLAPSVKKKPRYCQGGVFKPCVCPKDVPTIVRYRPAVKECGNNAAIILSGKYKDVFSVVVRDRENKDRWPPSGINGCTPYERDVLALLKCSAFKVQAIIPVENAAGDAEVHCLGASGYSNLFKRVTRMTAKLSDIPNSTQDPLARWCLAGPTKPLN
jgi:hypothetical protein